MKKLKKYVMFLLPVIPLFYLFLPSHLTGIINVVVIAAYSIKWGLRGGIGAAIYSTIIMILESLSTYGTPLTANIIYGIILYIVLGIGLGLILEHLYQQQEKLKKEIKNRQRAEMEILEKEEHFRSIIATVLDVMITLNRAGEYMEVWTGQNENLIKPRSELLGKKLEEVLPKEVAFKIRYHLGQALEYNQLQVFEYKLKVIGGLKHFEARLTAMNKDKAVMVVRDVTDRVKTERELEVQKAFFQQLFENSPEAIVIADNNEIIVQTNQAFKDMFGFREEEVVGKEINSLVVPEEMMEEAEEYKETVIDGGIVRVETVRQKKDGTKIDVAIVGYPIRLKDDRLGIYGIYRDITDRKRLERKLREYATYDSLTGIYNRRIGITLLEEKKKIVDRENTCLSLCFLDINDLKPVNDNYGHEAGDQLIKQVTSIISNEIREVDVFARMGGDEFLIIFPDCNVKDAEKIWKRIEKRFDGINKKGEYPYEISVSHGLAEYRPRDNISIDELITIADKKMYKEKRRIKAC